MGMMTVIKIFLATAGLLVLAFGLGLLWVKEGREDSSLEILMKGIVTAFAALTFLVLIIWSIGHVLLVVGIVVFVNHHTTQITSCRQCQHVIYHERELHI